MTARRASKRFRACLRAVPRMLERMAEASAPQAERKPPMTSRSMSDRRRSRSGMLLVGSTSSPCRKAHRLSRRVRYRVRLRMGRRIQRPFIWLTVSPGMMLARAAAAFRQTRWATSPKALAFAWRAASRAV